MLEILTYDVIRVSHGATAGPVDQEAAVTTCRARGLPRSPVAEAMLVRAFFQSGARPTCRSRRFDEELTSAIIGKLETSRRDAG